jgi:hypothetical protein
MAEWYVPATRRIGKLNIIDPKNLSEFRMGKVPSLLPAVIEFTLLWVDTDENGNPARGPEYIDTENLSEANKAALVRSYWGPDIVGATQKLTAFLEGHADEYGLTKEKPKRQRKITVSDDDAQQFQEWKAKQEGRPIDLTQDDVAGVDSAYIGARPVQGPRRMKT